MVFQTLTKEKKSKIIKPFKKLLIATIMPQLLVVCGAEIAPVSGIIRPILVGLQCF